MKVLEKVKVVLALFLNLLGLIKSLAMNFSKALAASKTAFSLTRGFILSAKQALSSPSFLIRVLMALAVALCAWHWFVASAAVALLFPCVAWMLAKKFHSETGGTSRLLPYLARLSKHRHEELVRNLRTIDNGDGTKKSLQSLWNANAQLEDKRVLLTGATGFVGRSILLELLSLMKQEQEDGIQVDNKIYLMIRPSPAGGDPKTRIQDLREEDCFSGLRTVWDRVVELVAVDDLSKPKFGMEQAEFYTLSESGISHVIHCAGNIRHDAPMEESAAANITAALQLQTLAYDEWNSKACIVVSDALASISSYTRSDTIIKEELVPLGRYKAVDLYHSMVGDQWLASKAMKELGIPSPYMLSKCVADHLLSRSNKAASVTKTVLIRAAIVGPSWILPFPGFNGGKQDVLSSLFGAVRSGSVQVCAFPDSPLPVIPVDVLAVGIIHSMLSENSMKSDSKVSIWNMVWFLPKVAQDAFSLWTVIGAFASWEAALRLLLCKSFHTNKKIAKHIDDVFNKLPESQVWKTAFATEAPVGGAFDVMRLRGLVPSYEKSLGRHHPYKRRQLPDKMEPAFYLASVLRTVENMMNVGVSQKKSDPTALVVPLIPDHRSDLWWALTQPNGNLAHRVVGVVTSKVLRKACSSISVDLASMADLAKEMRNDGSVPLCLAPTHRSVLDFVLISLLGFSMPGTGIKMPRIAAASHRFRHLMFASMLEWCGAFWVEQGNRGHELAATLEAFVKKGEHLMVFIEGQRSRDRRFLPPRYGFIKALQELPTSLGTPVLAPIAIDYERLPEHQSLASEMHSKGKKEPLSTSGVLGWLRQLFATQSINLGAVQITFGKPTRLQSGQSAEHVALEVQKQQRKITSITTFHLAVARVHLKIPTEALESVILSSEGNLLTGSTLVVHEAQRLSSIEAWCAHLQWMHLIAHLLRDSHPNWSTWILNEAQLGDEELRLKATNTEYNSEHLVTVLSKLTEAFEEADKLAEAASKIILSKGIPEPGVDHVLQVMESQMNTTASATTIVPPITSAAASFVARGNRDNLSSFVSDFAKDGNEEEAGTTLLPVYAQESSNPDAEHYGGWGFVDSGFQVVGGTHGVPASVRFKGQRYRISGKEFPTLHGFLEDVMGSKLPQFDPTCAEPKSVDESQSKKLLYLFLGNGFAASKLSRDPKERYRHGTGHCLEDIEHLRKGSLPRCPDLVVWPENEPDCVKIVELAEQHSMNLIPFGGGTNVTHATNPPPKEVDPRPVVSIDMRRMNKIVWLNKEDGLAHIEAGIVGRDVVKMLSADGFTMGHEPDSLEFSTLGGWIATRASGMKRNRYGNIEEMVKEVRMVTTKGVLTQHHHNAELPEGEQFSFGRVSVGTELKDLAMGSEGNYGLITSAVVRVHRIPAVDEYSSLVFPDFDTGFHFMREVARLPQALRPSSTRLSDNVQFQLAQHISGKSGSVIETFGKSLVKSYLGHWLKWNPQTISACTMVYEGESKEVAMQKQIINELATRFGGLQSGSKNGASGYDLTFAIAYFRDLIYSYQIYGESFETFVCWSRALDLCKGVEADVKKIFKELCLPGEPMICYRITQLYEEGCCAYFYLIMNLVGVTDPCAKFNLVEKTARESCLRYGGSLSHHHGVGKLRRHFMPEINSGPMNEWLKDVKKGIDPSNVFGCGNGVCGLVDHEKEKPVSEVMSWSSSDYINDGEGQEKKEN
ncbi:Alkyldihydroxyacetonephosphate synthase, peroxisomal [Seminavis robusta]|uniref:alkylglycerone-phosphate synthase n=1 Tax=Seminavis robusta TaxID=568900 RepID=A0A9N8HLE0_9STRA|nr:Alkyldihydroxyacetonephosphate synthase, peroxisomal [Seminavis robusta]|eukprot:Sro908_g218860.1 Alkyldihydroxyacetonephosphate synthase, peroxisomal (1694) ;mRNA; f:25872-31218